MFRWHLTAGLAGTAALAALLAPLPRGVTAATVLPPPPSAPPVAVAQLASSLLTLSAGLDRPLGVAGTENERYLVISLDAAETQADDRPLNVSVVIDRSGSMAARGKLEYARVATRELIDSLEGSDRASIVAFSDASRVLAPSSTLDLVPGLYPELPSVGRSGLLRAAEGLHAGGGTNLYAGLRDGLAQLSPYATDDSVDRLILLSDGNANVGITDDTSLARLGAEAAASGLSVSTIGLGLDFNEDLLASIADQGNGSYHFVDNPTTLAVLFEQELHAMSTVAARGVTMDVALPGVELVEVIGYPAQVSEGGFSVRVGDIYGGQTRKVVARVRLPAAADGSVLDVARVSVSESGGVQPLQALVRAEITSELARVENEVNRDLAVASTRAQISDLTDRAARAYADGDVAEMDALMESSERTAEKAATLLASDELADDARALKGRREAMGAAAPSSEAGRYHIKSTKEESRAWSHY